MRFAAIRDAVGNLEKANADLEPELLTAADAKKLLADYARAQKLAAFGVAALTRKINDPAEVAKAIGTSMGKAKQVVATGEVMTRSDDLSLALQQGQVSLDQASEVASAEAASPGSAKKLVKVAQDQGFHALRDEARRTKLDAEQHSDLGARQRAARTARSHVDHLGMVNVNLVFEPHIGTPFVNRAEAEAERLYRRAKKEGRAEPFERHRADAYARMLQGSPVKGRARRSDVVILVSHAIATRGWKDVKKGETCKIPGVGPVPPQVAKGIAEDAFLSGLFFDGKDLRHFKRWTRNTPRDVLLALELGKPPEFDGIKCVDCGRRLSTQNDHVDPHVAGGPASTTNLDPRCWDCHQEKTELDRKAGKLKPRAPDPERGPPRRHARRGRRESRSRAPARLKGAEL